jgi:RNA polymerase sigma-70 factor (ECF subfamily)
LSSVKDLVERAQHDDLVAFEELVLIYQDRVYSHCYNLAGNPEDAQDLAQDVFIQAYKNIRSFRQDADLGTWLYRIALNHWINLCRKKKLAVFSLDEPLAAEEGKVFRELAASDESPLEKVERSEFNAMVAHALKLLLPEFRIALVLRDIDGYNYEEIASILKCSLGTVKSRINRGRKALKKELEKYLKV